MTIYPCKTQSTKCVPWPNKHFGDCKCHNNFQTVTSAHPCLYTAQLTNKLHIHIYHKKDLYMVWYKLRHPNSCCFAGEGYVSYLCFKRLYFRYFKLSETSWYVLEEEFLQLWLFNTLLTVRFLDFPVDVIMPGEKKGENYSVVILKI